MRLKDEAERDCGSKNADLDDTAPEAPKEPAAEQDSHVDRVARSHFDSKLKCTGSNDFQTEGNWVDAVNVESSLWIRICVGIYSQVDHKGEVPDYKDANDKYRG